MDRRALPPARRSGKGGPARRGGVAHRLPGLPNQRVCDRCGRERRRWLGLRLMFDVETLIEAARGETGLDDFGGTTWREGLERLVDSLNNEATLTEGGEQILTLRIGMLLANRLR